MMDWFKKWWLWILLAIGTVLFIITRLLPSNGEKPKLFQEAKDRAKELKDKASADIERHRARMEERKKELKEIQSIEDEDERLKRLAEFANRR